jgi:DNA mismatch repair protein MutS2
LIQTETLELLEWSRLCQHLATFAATKLGTIAAQHLTIATTQAESQSLLTQTQEIYQLEQRLTTGLSFEGVEDITASLERAALQGMLTGEELVRIATTLAGMRRLRRFLDEQEGIPTLQEMIGQIRTYPELEQEIYHCIDERFSVMDRANPKLADIRQQLRKLRSKIEQMLQSIIQRQSTAMSQGIITQRGDRYVLPVKAPQKDAVPGIVHDTSSSGSTLYIEPHSIVNLGNQLRQLQRQEQREVEVVLRHLTAQVSEVKPDLEILLAVATSLDLATAKARYSLWLEANPPRFVERYPTENITLRQLRHPLLVWQQKHEQGFPVVPINIQINPQIKVVAITGPNTGGKTVTLKTLGLAALMAKVGLFIPAREPVEIPWFAEVLADIGDEQSLQQSLSTFSGHIRRISRILEAIKKLENQDTKNLSLAADGGVQLDLEGDSQDSLAVTPKATEKFLKPVLVLLDEVGAGTDPAEGSALAIALLKHLADHAELTIATTHYGELKALKYQDPRFENASVEFDEVSLSPTYRLLWGIPGRSNALTIAHRLGLPAEITEVATLGMGDTSADLNHVIAGLEGQRRQQEQKAAEATQLLQQTEALHRELSTKALALQQREQQLKQQQEQVVQEAIAQARGEIATVIRNLQKAGNTAQEAQKARQSLEILQEKHIPAKPKPQPGFHPQVGDRVRIIQLGQTGEVLSISSESQQLTVRFGVMKMTLGFTEIESLAGEKIPTPEAKKKPEEPKPSSLSVPVVRTTNNTIDLRGSRVAEAEQQIDQMLANRTEGAIWVIHGKGTGKLREGIHQFLQNHPQIAKYEPATDADGGAGATIAYLK